MEGRISYTEIDEWARSWENRGYYYKKVHPTYKILGISINQNGEKALFINDTDYNWIAHNLGYFDGHNSKELLTDFIHLAKKLDWWQDKHHRYEEYFNQYGGIPLDVFAPDEEKIFSTPVEAKPSPDNSDVPHFKTVVAHNYEEDKSQIEQRESEYKEASNVREVKVGKPFLLSLLEYFFKK